MANASPMLGGVTRGARALGSDLMFAMRFALYSVLFVRVAFGRRTP
jgi:hypothetical protein